METAGTVTQIAETTVSVDMPQGSMATADSTNEVANNSCAIDISSNKVVIVGRDSSTSSYLACYVGDINTTTGSISFGSRTHLTSSNSQYPRVVADPNDTGKFIVCWNDGGTQMKVGIISVSGTTPSLAGTSNFGDTSGEYPIIAADPNTTGSFVCVYEEMDSSTRHTLATAFTYTGSTITIGTEQEINTVEIDTNYAGVAFDEKTAGKFGIAWKDYASPHYLYFQAGTISGTTITEGTAAVVDSSACNWPRIAFDGNTAGKMTIAYWDTSGSDFSVICGTLSGTTPSWGSSVDITTAGTMQEMQACVSWPGLANTYGVVYKANSNKPYGRQITTAGTVPSAGTEVELSTNTMSGNQLSGAANLASKGGLIATWTSNLGSNPLESIYSQVGYTETNLTTSNFLGIADEAISASASGSIVVQGGTKTAANTILPLTTSLGSESVYESAGTYWTYATYDSDSDRIVAAYRDDGNSSYGTAVVGTVSGTSISWGTPVVFDTGGNYISVIFDSDSNKVVIAYQDYANSSYGTAIVGTVSGTSISFGTAVVFESATSDYVSATFDSTANKVVIAYTDTGNSGHGTAIVGTVSGTAISFGTAVVFESAATGYISAVYDSNADRTVISYMDDANSDYGTSIVGTVSGTAISFGTAVVFNAGESTYVSSTYDSTAQKVVISYMDGGSSPSNQGTAIVGTVSGTSISFGTEVIFNAASSNYMGMTYDANANQVVIGYQETSKGYVILGTTSGTSISFGTAVVFNNIDTSFISPVYNSTDNKIVIAYTDTGNSYYGTGIVGTIGDGTFTIGSNYYVQPDGSYDTSAGSPSVKAGLAISTTSLLLSGDS